MSSPQTPSTQIPFILSGKNTIDSLEQFISDAHLDKEKIQEQLEQFIY